jgi:cadmium resistance transport/sequestration family protein
MTNLAVDLALGIALFVATNVDDVFILLAFFADPRFRARRIVLGQYLGMGVLVLVSVLAALISLVIPTAYVGLLGLIPIAIGVKQLWEGRTNEAEEEASPTPREGGAHGQVLAVAAVTIANGGDNIAVYTPAFAVGSSTQTIVIISVFALLTALWCAFAYWLVNHPTIGAVIKRYGHRGLPFVLIVLGIVIIVEAGTVQLIHDARATGFVRL